MARFRTSLVSAAALAANTDFLWLMSAATRGFFLRRVTLGVITSTAVVPTSQQIQVNITPTSSAGTTPTANPAGISALNGSLNATPLVAADSAFATPPTLTGAPYTISFNSQSAVDLPWEQSDEWLVALATTNGLSFRNITNALPANHSITVTAEWEE